MAPLDRGAQRSLAGVAVSAALQQIEALTDPIQQLLHREERRSSRRELERERQLVEPLTQVRHGGRGPDGHVEGGGSRHEEGDRVSLLERRDRVEVLGPQLQAFATRDEQRRPVDG